MGVNGREYDRSGGVRAMPSPKGGLQTPKGATHTGGGGLVYGDGSWDLTVFVTDLQEFFRIFSNTKHRNSNARILLQRNPPKKLRNWKTIFKHSFVHLIPYIIL